MKRRKGREGMEEKEMLGGIQGVGGPACDNLSAKDQEGARREGSPRWSASGGYEVRERNENYEQKR